MCVTILDSDYSSLVWGTRFADVGNMVCGDFDAAKVQDLNRGKAPIHDPWVRASISMVQSTCAMSRYIATLGQ